MDKTLVAEVNKYLANIAVLYVKTHNLHWNVTGQDFKAAHEYLESIYDGLAESFDAVAEALKMQGEQPLASLKSYLEVATIKEIPSEELTSRKGYEIALADLKEMKAQAEAIHDKADATGVHNVANALDEDIGTFTKAIWFLTAATK